MNQILETKLKKFKSNKNFFKMQLTISIFFIIVFVIILILHFNSNSNKEKISSDISSNYNLYKLYSESHSETSTDDEILCTIEIPKINIKYPVFSKFDDELLKISPCRFYGRSPKEYGNLCIAGHNYNNSKFFSNLFLLNNGDEIIYNVNNNIKKYKVEKKIEIDSYDWSYLQNTNDNRITLITCVENKENKRLVVQGIEEIEE